jgi:glycosyltransferase involved in cell wall biosynthesis
MSAFRQDGGAPWTETALAVSVVIPHLNDLENLDHCLALLERQSFRSFEVVVVDNGSNAGIDAVRAITGSRGRVVQAPAKGAGPARNAGVESARGATLAFIDSDCRPDPDWIAEGLASLASHDIVGGSVRVDVDDRNNMSPTEAFEMVFAFRNDTYIRRKGFTVTASMFVRRDVFDAVGPFRVGVSEDMDWCHRARELGYRLGYAPNAIVGHPARRTWAELKRKSNRLASESFELYCEEPFGRLRWLARAWLIPASIVPHLIYVMTTMRLDSLRDRANAAWTLIRIRLVRFLEANRLAFKREHTS